MCTVLEGCGKIELRAKKKVGRKMPRKCDVCTKTVGNVGCGCVDKRVVQKTELNAKRWLCIHGGGRNFDAGKKLVERSGDFVQHLVMG